MHGINHRSSDFMQVPFAEDLRRWTFPSLDRLITGKGEVVTTHPYIPTDTQLDAMEDFVDALDLMEAGEKDEEGVWPRSLSAISGHRVDCVSVVVVVAMVSLSTLEVSCSRRSG